MRILLVEDDDLVADSLTLALQASGYDIDRCNDGSHAEIAAMTTPYDAVVLDLGLPGGMSGLEVLKRLRKKNMSVPVLILSARDTFEERIQGLDCGANDYVTKPFHLGELEARIRALLRISCQNVPVVNVGDISFDTVKKTVRSGDQIIELSPREFAVFEILIHNIGSVVTKQKMAALLSGWDEPVTYNAMDIVIHRLRKRLEPYGVKIQTIRGLGFLIEP